jgi:hypothetical protein
VIAKVYRFSWIYLFNELQIALIFLLLENLIIAGDNEDGDDGKASKSSDGPIVDFDDIRINLGSTSISLG